MRYVSIEQTIQFSICKISDIKLSNFQYVRFQILNYPIFNMQDFRYWLITPNLKICFGHVVSLLCNANGSQILPTKIKMLPPLTKFL